MVPFDYFLNKPYTNIQYNPTGTATSKSIKPIKIYNINWNKIDYVKRLIS